MKFYFLFFLSLFFMAFGRFERRRSCVMVGEFRYSVDSRLIIVEILGLDFVFCILIFFGVLVVDILGFEFFVCWSFCNNLFISSCWVSGVGLIFLRVKRSVREVKYFNVLLVIYLIKKLFVIKFVFFIFKY